MAEVEEHVELKFRIYDGTDIGHGTYASSTTVATIKQRLVAEWPQDKSVMPKIVSDLKLIHAGKFLENSTTLAESRVHVGDDPGGVITMHVVVQPPVANKKTDKDQDEMRKNNWCSSGQRGVKISFAPAEFVIPPSCWRQDFILSCDGLIKRQGCYRGSCKGRDLYKGPGIFKPPSRSYCGERSMSGSKCSTDKAFKS
ncbi:unnamed protein product [Ilex paraguariensis]|uniref:Ubiquitin-like domain-containing protein n=1 Tax=Ilex paraguariensis TaxID=185542 RepID=A0ABC8U2F6_9AQUA